MASLTLRWAAAAVRRLACTAMYMPMKPARPEQKAPTRNAIAVRTPWPGSLPSQPISTPMMTAAATASTAMVRYCRFRNAIAPSKIRLATSCIALVPRSWESTSRASQAANRIAMIPASNTTGQNCIGTLVLLHSRRPTPHRAGQSVRDGRRPCGARLWRKTTHGDASHAAASVYHLSRPFGCPHRFRSLRCGFTSLKWASGEALDPPRCASRSDVRSRRPSSRYSAAAEALSDTM